MKMKICFALLAVAACSVACGGNPVVSGVTLSQNPTNLGVTVEYALSGGPAIVTVDFLTNGVSIGATNLRNVGGDVNTYVAVGAAKRIYWPCDSDWPGRFIDDGSLTADVKAWPLDDPPDYMVCDLETTNDVSFYVSEAALPLEVTNALYKTTKLVMRRIHAANVTWCMGSPSAVLEKGCTQTENEDVSIPHMVTLTEDYYIGVFEVTQRQYYFITGGGYYVSGSNAASNGGQSPSEMTAIHAYVTAAAVPMRPVETVCYNDLRGSDYDWPVDRHAVAPNSAFGKLRALTGIGSFDLPTEAQWEYACRAGTCTGLNSGKEVTTTGDAKCANAGEVGWYGGNPNNPYGNAQKAPHPVGMLQPNRWGLYDMHGNIFELCLDYYSEGADYKATFATGWQSGEPTIDPTGPTSGTYTVYRGGNWYNAPRFMRSSRRYASSQNNLTRAYKSKQYGFRLVCRANFK